MDIENRLKEWSENRGMIDVDKAIGYAEVNTIGRLIQDGGASGSSVSGNGPIPGIVQRLSNRMETARRVLEVEAAFALLPDEMMGVVICEWIEGMGRPRICNALNITESEARRRRERAIGFIHAALDLRPIHD